MRVLVVGSGGREHALVWRLRQEDPSIEIVAAPGNPGIAELAECVPIGADIDALAQYARQSGVTWTLVGPEVPLGAGIVDAFRGARLRDLRPTRPARCWKRRRRFRKCSWRKPSCPPLDAITCTDLTDAYRAISEIGAPVVVKASGLAAGKGVIICETVDEARSAAAAMLKDGAFGTAGDTILVEEFMEGEELSVFAMTDGERVVVLPSAQDNKRLLERDRGPNTGGMGAYSPVSLVSTCPTRRRDCRAHRSPNARRHASAWHAVHRIAVRRRDADRRWAKGG
jgi:phosphoribosylamine--glycine ligase